MLIIKTYINKKKEMMTEITTSLQTLKQQSRQKNIFIVPQTEHLPHQQV